MAHLQPSGSMDLKAKSGELGRTGRWKMWSDTYSTTEAVISDRMPEIESVTVEGDGLKAGQYAVKTKIADSNTRKIHGGKTTREGNVGYNDNHVEFVTTLGPIPGASLGGEVLDQGSARSGWMCSGLMRRTTRMRAICFWGCLRRRGEKPEEFKGIWD